MKDTTERYKGYSNFGFEEFLGDDFFIASMSNPTPETEKFWEGYLTARPANESQFGKARELIRQLNAEAGSPSPEEKRLMWYNISVGLQSGLRSKKRRKRVLAVASLAAAVCVGAVVFTATLWKNSHVDEILKVAGMAIPEIGASGNAMLVLSDKREILIGEKESEITYNGDDIKVSDEVIPVEEAAEYNQLIVPRGKMSRLTLSDGTTVWVHANTRVIYPVEFAAKEREIYVDGEIFVDVVKDEKRPFIVKTGDIRVRVLGTRFNLVSREGAGTQSVVVVSGSVAVGDGSRKNETLLAPDQMFENSGGTITVKTVDTRKYVSWVDKLYYYDKESLKTVVDKLSDFYGIEITCDSRAAQYRCSGKLDLRDDVADVINILCLSMPLRYEYLNGNYNLIYNE